MSTFEQEARANAKKIKFEIEMLESGHWDFFKRNYKEFWAHAKKISYLFKTLKPLKKNDREELWEHFSRVCDNTKEKQQSERGKRSRLSESHRSDIMREAEKARPCSLFGFAPPDVNEMKSLGSVLRNASRMLSKYKEEMFGEHKQECFQLIGEIREIHDRWWSDLKQHKSKKHSEFQERVRRNIQKNQERHRKATEALERMRSKASELQDKINSAWNDEFRSRAYGWLSETEDKIRDIENSIYQIEEWIREDEQKLR